MIQEWISSMSPREAAAQLIGVAALLFNIVSFQQKNQRKLVLWQAVTSVTWAVSQGMLFAVAGMLMNIIGVCRAAVFSFRPAKKWARSPLWFVVFILAIFGVGIYSLCAGETPICFLPVGAMILTTFAVGQDSAFTARKLSFLNSPLWLIYNLSHGAAAGALSEVINMVFIMVAFIRLDIPVLLEKRRQKTQKISKNY